MAKCQASQHTPITPVLRRVKQEDCLEFMAASAQWYRQARQGPTASVLLWIFSPVNAWNPFLMQEHSNSIPSPAKGKDRFILHSKRSSREQSFQIVWVSDSCSLSKMFVSWDSRPSSTDNILTIQLSTDAPSSPQSHSASNPDQFLRHSPSLKFPREKMTAASSGFIRLGFGA